MKKEQTNDYGNFNEMVTAHRGVLKSLIDRDGYYKNSEAVEINNGFGKQLSFLKLTLEAYKLMGIMPTEKDLFLLEKTTRKKNGTSK
tara:strand:- start:181 stop:441 length:261 start_codon:yes stop_codon:yes gene_type:complete